MVTKQQILNATKCNSKNLDIHFDSIILTLEKYDINTPQRIAAFLANAIHETGGFKVFEENLNYTKPEALVKLFRIFDLNKDRIVDPEEIEFAKGFIRNPEKLANHIYSNRYGNGDNEG